MSGEFSGVFPRGNKKTKLKTKNTLNVIITKKDNFEHGNHINRLKHSIFVNY